jgi:hypothetical protein
MYPNYLAGLYFPDWNRFGFINIAVTDSKTAVRLTSLGDLLAGGVDGSNLGGDLALSMVPVAGIWTDIRDAAMNLGRMFPGGESPEYNVLAFSVLGLFTEIFPPTDFRIATAAVGNSKLVAVSFDALRESFYGASRVASEVSDLILHADLTPVFREFLDAYIKKEAHLSDFAVLARKLGSPELAENMVNEIVEVVGDSHVYAIIQRLRSLSADHLQVLKTDGWTVVKRGMGQFAQTGLDTTSLKVYADALYFRSIVPDIERQTLARFEQLADVKGSWTAIGRGIGDTGVQAEFAAAAKIGEAEAVRGMNIKYSSWITNQKGDVDIITDTSLIEVKASQLQFDSFVSGGAISNRSIRKCRRSS